MMTIMRDLDRDIREQVDKLLSKNVWMLAADSATSKDHRLFSIDACNEENQCLHVQTFHSAWRRQDSMWLKDQLKDVAAKIPSLAGLAQDSAAVCKAAFKKLHADLPAVKQHRCFEIVCCEHQAQLLNQDLAAAIPWMKDSCDPDIGRVNLRKLYTSFFPNQKKGYGLFAHIHVLVV